MKTNGNGKRKWKWIFFLYVLIIIRVIIFKYPYSELREIMSHWQNGVVWEGLSTANFTLFITISMYIKY